MTRSTKHDAHDVRRSIRYDRPGLSVPEVSHLCHLLSEPCRLRLMLLLVARGETCVGDLAQDLGLTYPMVSAHLQRLRLAGLVERRREAQWNYYRLSSPLVANLLGGIVTGGETGRSRLPSGTSAGREMRP